MAPSPAVELAEVSKCYGARRALDGVSFRLEPGESVGYLGPNGAGKTTTFRVLTGLARPDGGTVELAGHDPRRDRTAALARVGTLIENPGLLPYVTGRDLLGHIAEVRAIARTDRPGEVSRAAERFGISDQLDRPLGTLSTGLGRRVLLAGALLGSPEILLLDEPTLGLDPAARAGLRRTLNELRGEGRTLLISSHLLDDIEQLCDRVLFLRSGRLVGDERVRAEGRSEGRARAVRVRFLDPPAEPALRALLGRDETVDPGEGTERTFRFSGGDPEQADLLARIHAAGLRFSSAVDPGPDLARRYGALVGGEEDQ